MLHSSLQRLSRPLSIVVVLACAACASTPKAPAPAAQAEDTTRTASAEAGAPAKAPEAAPAKAPESAAAKPPAAPAKTAPRAAPPAARKPAAPSAPVAKAPAAPATQAQTPPAAKAPAPAAAPLDVRSLEERLKETPAIGLMTKLSLKNQVDDLLQEFREYHAGRLKASLAELRHGYDLLLMKVLSLLQDADPGLAKAIHDSREAIWGILVDRDKFSKYA